jgi:DNA-directed RNA polymerase specialized sigma subunit
MTNHYLSGKDLYKEAILSKNLGKVTIRLSEMFYELSKRMSRKFVFRNEMDKEDSISYSYLKLYENFYQFDPSKTTNAFAYYTEISKRAFTKSYHIQRNNSDKKGWVPTNNLTTMYPDGNCKI